MRFDVPQAISVEFSNLHAILKSGSALYRKYLARRNLKKIVTVTLPSDVKPNSNDGLLSDAMRNLNVLELLDCNSALRKLSAVQKRHLESLAEGPLYFQPGERLWRAGAPVDKAFVVVSGTASFVPRRRNAGSVGLPATSKAFPTQRSYESSPSSDSSNLSKLSLGETMRRDAMAAVRELRIPDPEPWAEESSPSDHLESAGTRIIQLDAIFSRPGTGGQEGVPSSLTDAHDYAKLSRGLKKRADILNKQEFVTKSAENQEYISEMVEDDDSLQNPDHGFLDIEGDESGRSTDSRDRRVSLARRRSSRARFANKVLGRLYSRRAFTGGLVFSRGHFLGDVSKMVAGLLSIDKDTDVHPKTDDSAEPVYGLGEKIEGLTDSLQSQLQTVNEIHEQDGNELAVVHSSTLTAGKEGCVVLIFPKASLIPFLDEYPGLLLSLLGTQVVV